MFAFAIQDTVIEQSSSGSESGDASHGPDVRCWPTSDDMLRYLDAHFSYSGNNFRVVGLAIRPLAACRT